MVHLESQERLPFQHEGLDTPSSSSCSPSLYDLQRAQSSSVIDVVCSTPGNHLSVLQAQIQEAPTHFCPYPASLQGSRCYVDVAVVPDNQNINTNNAGLGIFIINFQVQPLQAIYVKAQLHNCQSVLMGEAAALALGATIVRALQIQSCNFLLDSQQLVHFLHQEQQQNPSQWRIKPFTQVYSNIAASLQTQLFKINRTQNTTTDTLAK